jgi:hypothetical protein
MYRIESTILSYLSERETLSLSLMVSMRRRRIGALSETFTLHEIISHSHKHWLLVGHQQLLKDIHIPQMLRKYLLTGFVDLEGIF